MVIVFNFLRLMLCLFLLFLQACQQKNSLDSESVLFTKKQNDAALYNTQLGLAYLEQEDRLRAKRKLLTALKLAPDSPDVNAAIAYYFETTGELKEADKYYKKALALAPKKGEQLNNYGSHLCRLGHYKEAEKYFLSAVKDVYYVNTAGAYENAGLCAAAIPNYLKAKQFFSKALELDPKRKQSLYELVKIELKINQAEKALAHMKKYAKLSADDPELLALAVEASHRLGDKEAGKAYL